MCDECEEVQPKLTKKQRIKQLESEVRNLSSQRYQLSEKNRVILGYRTAIIAELESRGVAWEETGFQPRELVKKLVNTLLGWREKELAEFYQNFAIGTGEYHEEDPRALEIKRRNLEAENRKLRKELDAIRREEHCEKQETKQCPTHTTPN